MKRIFIAIKIVPEDRLLKLISSLRTGLNGERIKWTELENIHLTIAFLGDTEEEKIKSIQKMLIGKCKGFGQFELILRGTGLFRNISDPRVIWTGIAPSEDLVRLNNDIKNGLGEAGIPIEDRPFNPHLTLGRIKHVGDKSSLKTLLDKFSDIEIQKLAVNEVILYESILKQTGPVYKPIGKYNLL
jgi:2'-5' RNA ligase